MKFPMRLLLAFVILLFCLVSCGDKEEVKSLKESEQGVSNSSDISNNRIEISEQENSVSSDNSDPLNSGLAKKSDTVSISEPENDNSGIDQEESFSQLLGKAQSGEAVSQFKVAGIYESGSDEVPQNLLEAARWYRMAAEQNHSQSQYNLGMMYQSGHGVAEDTNEANKWFDRYNQNKD